MYVMVVIILSDSLNNMTPRDDRPCIYTPHAVPFKNAIDCWRAFECHWLNLKGQPQFAALQCVIAGRVAQIDTFALKQLFVDMNQQKFIGVDNVIVSLSNSALLENIDADWSLFLPSFGKPELSSLSGHFYQQHTVRFICQTSKQPFTGEIQVLLSKPLAELDTLNWLLLDKRSQEFDPPSYVDALFSTIKLWAQSCVISVHLARRGGISYQGLRWHEQSFIDPRSLIQLSSVE